jgi:hypothetical protein
MIRAAIEHYREDVERRVFPSDEESYHLAPAVRQTLDASAKTGTLRSA